MDTDSLLLWTGINKSRWIDYLWFLHSLLTDGVSFVESLGESVGLTPPEVVSVTDSSLIKI